jgi:hypothetical protein
MKKSIGRKCNTSRIIHRKGGRRQWITPGLLSQNGKRKEEMDRQGRLSKSQLEGIDKISQLPVGQASLPVILQKAVPATLILFLLLNRTSP